jgi:hypothetical protein
MPAPRTATTWAFAIGNVLLAALVLGGVFGGLGVRWWIVDVPSVAVAALLLGSSFGLARATHWAMTALRACAMVELGIGVATLAGLVISMVYLASVHGEIGRSGTTTLLLGVTLLLPYLVVYPSVQLLWLRRQRQFTQHA